MAANNPHWVVFFLALSWLTDSCRATQISLGSKLMAGEGGRWVSENGTFAFGFTQNGSPELFQLSIWFANLPGDTTLVWSANRTSPVSKEATVELDAAGNLVLSDGSAVVWSSNTSKSGAQFATMLETGNFVIYDEARIPIWQSFSHPSDTLLPNQPLTVSLELSTSIQFPSHGGFYTLKMLQQHTSLTLALTYNLLYSSANYSYWSAPDISNVTGEVIAVLDEEGSFGIAYGESSVGAVYVYKNDGDNGGLSAAINRSTKPSTLRRLALESNGNLRLYRWDDDVNGSRQWVPEWAPISNPCDIAGACGNGICNLDKTKTNASCSCLPGTYREEGVKFSQCYEDSNSSIVGKCDSRHENLGSELTISAFQQTNYYHSESSVIANYSDIKTVSKCGDACLSNCECVASIYGLSEEKPYCWILKSLDFGGFEDPSSTLFVKFNSNGSTTLETQNGSSSSHGSKNVRDKVLILPIVLTMAVLIGLLCLLLYYNIHRKRALKRSIESSLILSGAPISFTFRDLQIRTSNFSQFIGVGGFGRVYKGSLGDGTLVAVKKLEKVLPHGEKEFITEVNTIGSMQHMNLVRLCGYCSEGSHRLLVYEFMKNGSLDKWIFLSHQYKDRVLDWPTRMRIAIGTAQGIAYFHEQCRNRIIHCDIKPENILLDEEFCPKVSDFGLAKLMGREHSHVVTMIRGTRGYLAPEWVSNRPITVKADVYSYGMLLLEIIGGRRNFDMSLTAEDFFYPGWAYKEIMNEMPLKVADKRLKGAVDEEEITRALKVAFWCIQDDVSMRPMMGEIVRMLEPSYVVETPPIPQTIAELVDEGLDAVYKAMKRDLNQYSSFTINTTQQSSRATCSYSTMSPR